jgi:hypothetical protein
MATQVNAPEIQSLSEKRTWNFDFTNDLASNVTVSTATATHIAPFGTSENPTVGIITSPIVPVQLGTLSVIGDHVLSVVATLSDGEKSEIIMKIKVVDKTTPF